MREASCGSRWGAAALRSASKKGRAFSIRGAAAANVSASGGISQSDAGRFCHRPGTARCRWLGGHSRASTHVISHSRRAKSLVSRHCATRLHSRLISHFSTRAIRSVKLFPTPSHETRIMWLHEKRLRHVDRCVVRALDAVHSVTLRSSATFRLAVTSHGTRAQATSQFEVARVPS